MLFKTIMGFNYPYKIKINKNINKVITLMRS